MAFGLFKKKKKEVKNSDDKYLKLKVREVVKETIDAVSIVFDTDNETLPYTPGQFITLIDEVDGRKIRRAYSLCTSPYTDDYPAVTVKRVKDGLMSNHVNDKIMSGAELEIMVPMGQFTTDFDANRKRHVVLFGGGSGITPLMSIAKSVLDQEPDSLVSLVYANETFEDVIFRAELDKLKVESGERFRVVHVLNNPPEDWTGSTGWMNAEKVKSILSDLPQIIAENTEYFTCGPAPMMDIVVDGLKAMGIDEGRIKLESFEAGKTSPQEIIDSAQDPGQAKSVKVVIDDDEFAFSVASDKTILEQGLEENIDMPYSCQSGLCTACRGKLLSGEVKMGQSDGLSQSEIDDGYILCCQAFAQTDDVVIEIG